jgi:hypothetical protein
MMWEYGAALTRPFLSSVVMIVIIFGNSQTSEYQNGLILASFFMLEILAYQWAPAPGAGQRKSTLVETLA